MWPTIDAMMTRDERYMMRCLELARRGVRSVAPNPMVGAVLVCEGRIIGEGWHERFGGPHAEVNCFNSVRSQDRGLIAQSTLYVSLEPCSHYGKTPPCADLVVREHPRRLVAAMSDPNPLVAGKGFDKIRRAGIEVVSGVLEDEARRLNKRFLCLQENKRPYITLKWAQSSDGFLDRKRHSAAEPVAVISNAATKCLVHKMRAENMAILVGGNTARLDNPGLLTTRWTGRNPLRCVVTHTPPALDAKLMNDKAETLIFDSLPDLTEHPHQAWQQVMDALTQRGIHSLIVEGGALTLQSLINIGLWDEAQIETGSIALHDGVKAPTIFTI